MIDYIKILKQEEAVERSGYCGNITAYNPCELCGDNCKETEEACTYYLKYLNAKSARENKIAFLETIEDFMKLPIRTLLEKKRKAPLIIAETKQITRNQKKHQDCHNRKIGL